MAFYRKSGGGNAAPSVVRRRSGGAWANVQTIKRRSGGSWVTVWVFYDASLGVSASSHVYNSKTSTYNWSSASNSATAYPSGGTAPYTYSWSRVAGASPSISNATSQTCGLQYSSVSTGDYCVLQCVVSDSAGHSVTKQVAFNFN